jgi:hypothetical protein
VGSYQIAGTPFIIGGTITGGAEVEIKFPAVPKSITIINKDASSDDIYVHFASTGLAGNPVITNNHYITLDTLDTSVTMNVKCRSIFLSAPGANATYELYAELTGIATEMMPDLNVLNWPGISD